MKRLGITAVIILHAWVANVSAQVPDGKPPKEKPDQKVLYNDFYVSYGTGTLYYFIDHMNMQGNTLSGTFQAGYSRSITDLIAVGFQLSYTNIGRTEEVYDYSSSYYPPATYNNSMTDNLWQGIAQVRFRYLNKPAFCMYSGIGMGVTMDYYTKNVNNVETKGQKLLPAGQMTLLGIRAGRVVSFFGEFGIGTNYILNAGVSYKFGD
jgi:hypothetical protein